MILKSSLFATIIKWLPKRKAVDSSATSPPAVLTDTEEQGSSDPSSAKAEHRASPINPQALTKVLGDNTAAHLDMLQTFISQTENIIADFDTAYGQRDTGPVSFHAHNLKSSARTVGADSLADLCVALELMSLDADWNGIDRLHPQLRPALERVKDYVSRL